MIRDDVHDRIRRGEYAKGLEDSVPGDKTVGIGDPMVRRPMLTGKDLSQPHRAAMQAPVDQIYSLSSSRVVEDGLARGGVVQQGSGVAQTAPEYEFLQCTGDFKPVDVASRRLIRSHVMRNYFQEKRNQANGLSSASSASTVNAKDKLKGRWRLDPPLSTSKESIQSNDLTTPRRASTNRRDSAVSRRESKLSTSTSGSRKNSREEAVSEERVVLLNSFESHGNEKSGLDGLTPWNLALEQFEASSWDPFNTLPMKTGKRVDRLLTFCKSLLHPIGKLQQYLRKVMGLYL